MGTLGRRIPDVANRLHMHGALLCNVYECAKDKPEATPEDFARAGISQRAGDEARGICPDSGLAFQECFDGPCDCFLPTASTTISSYVDSCQREVIRQSKINKGKAS